MKHFPCVALREIQYGRKREALLTQHQGGPWDGQTGRSPWHGSALPQLGCGVRQGSSKGGQSSSKSSKEPADSTGILPGFKVCIDQLTA